jgi:predicted nuclease of predicted toxin-antitoxin system
MCRGWLNAPRGTDDDAILRTARDEQRVIITFDRDFGELVYHHHEQAPGIVFLRLQPPSPAGLLADFRRIWPRVSSAALGNFIVATHNKIRTRPIVELGE